MIGYAPGHVKALYQISMVQRATSVSAACQLLSSPG